MIGLGIVTVPERADSLRQVTASVDAHLSSVVDVTVVNCDEEHRGVAWNKNQVVGVLLDEGCTWLVLCEDDITVGSPEAVTGYVEACEASGYAHLSFHGHGPLNPTPLRSHERVTEWPNYVGAWCIYSAESFRRCGLFDEGFHNAWEHVEHTLRLAARGFTAQWRGAADATGSERWLAEIPGSFEASVIRRSPTCAADSLAGLDYWRRAHPGTYRLVFG